MIVAADAADTTSYKVGVARIFTFHKDAVAAKDRRSAVAFDHFSVVEVNLGKDAQAADDTGDRVPVHLYQISRFRWSLCFFRVWSVQAGRSLHK
jgi:hypothetical protein